MVKTSEKDNYKANLVLDKQSINAPAKKGTVVGHVEIDKKSGKDYGFIDNSANGVEVVTTATVEKANWLSLTFKKFGKWIAGLFS